MWGDALIAIGMAVATCSPTIYVLMIAFFFFAYQAIIFAEEHYLADKFGAEYELYCSRVNRLVPSVRLINEAFSSMSFNGMSALRHDLSTVAGLTIGLIALPVWRSYFLEDASATQTAAARALVLACTVGLLYALLSYLKNHKRLFY